MGYVPQKTGSRVSVLLHDGGTCLVPGIVLGKEGNRLEVMVRKSSGMERVKVQAHSDYVGFASPEMVNVCRRNGTWAALEAEAAKGFEEDAPGLDLLDRAIVAQRLAKFNLRLGPREGDFVAFADGVVRRISHDWGDSYQTSDGGSWYLGEGNTSFSGSLFSSVPGDTLTETGERRKGSVWIFHHDDWRAHNGVHTSVSFRVFKCSLPAPR